MKRIISILLVICMLLPNVLATAVPELLENEEASETTETVLEDAEGVETEAEETKNDVATEAVEESTTEEGIVEDATIEDSSSEEFNDEEIIEDESVIESKEAEDKVVVDETADEVISNEEITNDELVDNEEIIDDKIVNKSKEPEDEVVVDETADEAISNEEISIADKSDNYELSSATLSSTITTRDTSVTDPDQYINAGYEIAGVYNSNDYVQGGDTWSTRSQKPFSNLNSGVNACLRALNKNNDTGTQVSDGGNNCIEVTYTGVPAGNAAYAPTFRLQNVSTDKKIPTGKYIATLDIYFPEDTAAESVYAYIDGAHPADTSDTCTAGKTEVITKGWHRYVTNAFLYDGVSGKLGVRFNVKYAAGTSDATKCGFKFDNFVIYRKDAKAFRGENTVDVSVFGTEYAKYTVDKSGVTYQTTPAAWKQWQKGEFDVSPTDFTNQSLQIRNSTALGAAVSEDDHNAIEVTYGTGYAATRSYAPTFYFGNGTLPAGEYVAVMDMYFPENSTATTTKALLQDKRAAENTVTGTDDECTPQNVVKGAWNTYVTNAFVSDGTSKELGVTFDVAYSDVTDVSKMTFRFDNFVVYRLTEKNKTVTFDAGEGELEGYTEPVSIYRSIDLSKYVPTHEEDIFKGWKVQETDEILSGMVSFTENVVLEAVWEGKYKGVSVMNGAVSKLGECIVYAPMTGAVLTSSGEMYLPDDSTVVSSDYTGAGLRLRTLGTDGRTSVVAGEDTYIKKVFKGTWNSSHHLLAKETWKKGSYYLVADVKIELAEGITLKKFGYGGGDTDAAAATTMSQEEIATVTDGNWHTLISTPFVVEEDYAAATEQYFRLPAGEASATSEASAVYYDNISIYYLAPAQTIKIDPVYNENGTVTITYQSEIDKAERTEIEAIGDYSATFDEDGKVLTISAYGVEVAIPELHTKKLNITYPAINLGAVTSKTVGIRATNDDYSGLRFKASVTDYQAETVDEYGFIIAREDTMNGEVLTHDICDGYSIPYVVGKAYEKDVIDHITFSSENNLKCFAGVVTGIPKVGYSYRLVCRPYVLAGGNYYYGDTVSASIEEIAQQIIEQGTVNSLSAEQQALIYDYAGQTNPNA